MRKALEARHRQRDKLIARARLYARKVRKLVGECSVVLIGSVARGDFNLWSDLDILVISDGLPANPLERSRLLYSVAPGGVEPKGYTVAEFKELLHRRHPIILEARRSGIVLLDGGTWEKLN